MPRVVLDTNVIVYYAGTKVKARSRTEFSSANRNFIWFDMKLFSAPLTRGCHNHTVAHALEDVKCLE